MWTSGVSGRERLAIGPGWGDVADLVGQVGPPSQVLLVGLGRRRRFCWSGGIDDVGDRVGAVRWGCVVGALGRRRHLGGRADVVVSQGEGQVLVDACCL